MIYQLDHHEHLSITYKIMSSIIIVLAQAIMSSASAQEPPKQRQRAFSALTISDVLSAEDAGAGVVLNDGLQAIVERQSSYNSASGYVRGYLSISGRTRSRLWLLDAKKGSARLLFPKEQRPQFLGRLSPDGHRLAISIVDPHSVKQGIWAVGSSNIIELGIRAEELMDGYALSWLSDDWIAFVQPPVNRKVSRYWGERESAEYLPALWADTFTGNKPSTSEVISGGAHRLTPAPRASLVVMNIDSREMITLSRGDFSLITPHPARRAFIALENVHQLPLHTIADYRDGTISRLQAWWFDLENDYRARLCRGCSIFPGTVSWSPSGNMVAMVISRWHSADPEQKKLVVYNINSGSSDEPIFQVPIDSRNLTTFGDPIYRWAGDRLAFRTTDSAELDGRWAIWSPESKMRYLDEALQGELVATSSVHLLFLNKGNLIKTSVDPTVSRNDLVLLRNVRRPRRAKLHALVHNSSKSYSEQSISVMQTVGKDRFLLSIDLEHDRISSIKLGKANSVFLDIGPRGKSAVLTDGNPIQNIEFISSRSNSVSIKMNQRFGQIEKGRELHIAFRDRFEEVSHAWLLLPPSSQFSPPYPVVVYTYGNSRVAERQKAPFKVTSREFNAHVLAANGYAVLRPTLKMMPPEADSDPAIGLSIDFSAAVKAACETGFVDCTRIGVYGHSFGMFTALSILRETDIVKAAVVGSGVSNPVSYYGSFGLSYTVLADREVDRILWNRWGWAERGQGRMGAPPWADPQKYLRNSAVFNADDIATPLFLFHGDLDVVPISQSEEVFSALMRQGRDASFVRYWGEGHNFSSPANIRDLWCRMMIWYAEYLHAPYPQSDECLLVPASGL